MRWWAIMAILILSIVVSPVFAQTSQFSVTQNGQSFVVKYDITGAVMDDISVNPQDTSIIVSLKSSNDGNLTLVMPRNLIDAKTATGDDKFFILVDGAESEFTENKTNSDRTVMVSIPRGTEQVEVIGTQVGTLAVPEFGGMSVGVLVLAIFSIVVLSTKTRLKF